MFANADMFGEDVSHATPTSQSSLSPAFSKPLTAAAPNGLPPRPAQSLYNQENRQPNTFAAAKSATISVSAPDRVSKLQQLRQQSLDRRKAKQSGSSSMITTNTPVLVPPIQTFGINSHQSTLDHSPWSGGSSAGVGVVPINRATSIPRSISNQAISANRPGYSQANSHVESSPRSPLSGGLVSPTSLNGKQSLDFKQSNNTPMHHRSTPSTTTAQSQQQPTSQATLTQAEKSLLEQGIAPTYDPIQPSDRTRMSLSAMPAGSLYPSKLISDMKQFVTQIPPRGQVVQCYIMRNKKGLTNRLYPQYDLYLQEDDIFMLSSKKKAQNKTSNYMISNEAGTYGKDGPAYVGKVRSNFVGTEFVSYDKGINPSKVNADDTVATLTVRTELAAVFYESNILGSRGPRKMIALVPAVKGKDDQRSVWRPLQTNTKSKNDDDDASSGMIAAYKQNPNNDDFITLTNKTPKWNEQVGAYVLNFNGRVTQASVKNFQLIADGDPETVLLQFGRIDKDHFTMDYQWPLTAVQAFQICLSSFDYKLACE